MSPSARRRINGPAWTALLAEILRGVPRLDGALCADKPEAFDFSGVPGDARTQRAAEAIAVCRRCPALSECRRWVDGLPGAHRPHGVAAGTWMPRTAALPPSTDRDQ